MVVHAPQQAEPQRADPYAQANPYGLPAVQERPYVPMQGINSDRVAQQSWNNQKFVNTEEQTVGMRYVVAGVIFFALSIVGLIPNSPIYFISYGGIFSIIGAARILSQRSKGYRYKLWPPIVAICFAGAAVLIGGSLFVLNHIAASDYSSSNSSLGTSQGTDTSGTQSGDSSATLPASPTFAGDPTLTQYETSVGLIAHSIYAAYNGGQVSATAPQWPTTISSSGGSVTFPDGTSAATIPGDEVVKYVRSSDGKYFDLAVTGTGSPKEIAVYDSQSNQYTWACDTGAPSNCPTGGIDPNSNDDTSTSNS